jgi:hypothetical protein
MERINPNHPLSLFMVELVNQHVDRHISTSTPSQTRDYIAGLLLDFMRTDALYRIKNDQGQSITSIIEMIAEGDIRLQANSFEREREVHKHIGDFILFWSGVYPDHLQRVAWQSNAINCDYTRQGQESYRLVSSFNYAPYDQESPTFAQLSEGFTDFAFVLRQVAQQSGLYAA